jgi:hypothetical protein
VILRGLTMKNNTLNNDYVLYSINVEDAQNVANETIDRDLTDSEIKKVEERLGDYLPNWFDLLEIAIDDVVSD